MLINLHNNEVAIIMKSQYAIQKVLFKIILKSNKYVVFTKCKEMRGWGQIFFFFLRLHSVTRH